MVRLRLHTISFVYVSYRNHEDIGCFLLTFQWSLTGGQLSKEQTLSPLSRSVPHYNITQTNCGAFLLELGAGQLQLQLQGCWTRIQHSAGGPKNSGVFHVARLYGRSESH